MISIMSFKTRGPVPYDDELKKYIRVEVSEYLYDFRNIKFGP